MFRALFGSASVSVSQFLAFGESRVRQEEKMQHERLRTQALVIITGLVLAGCATIVEGTDQAVTIKTEPPGASCILFQESNKLAEIGSTPSTITLEKSSKDLRLECTKDGYFKEIATQASSFESMTIGNIIFGGIIGAGIDAASGAMNKYPSEVTVLLTPTSFETEKAREDFFSDRREYLISETERSTAKIRKNCLPELKDDCEEEIDELEKDLRSRLEVVETQRAKAKIGVASS